MNTTTSNQVQLMPHEWLSIAFLISVLSLLTIASHSCESESLSSSSLSKMTPHHLLSEDIEVHVEGAVELPGKYLIKRGSTVKELIDIAKPKPEADLHRIKFDGILKKGQRVIVSSKEVVKIILKFQGVEPSLDTKEMTLPKGTKLEELLLLYTFSEEVDLQKLKKKRRLKDGEVIIIPLKKSPSLSKLKSS